MQTIIDGLLANYEIKGEKNKNSILILHGWKRSLNDWQEVAKTLSSKNKVIILDLPGMGASSKPNTPFNTYDYADFVDKFIAKLQLKNVTLVGHSFGGRTAIIQASKNKAISKLVLV